MPAGAGGAIAGAAGAAKRRPYGDSFTPPTSQGGLAGQQVCVSCVVYTLLCVTRVRLQSWNEKSRRLRTAGRTGVIFFGARTCDRERSTRGAAKAGVAFTPTFIFSPLCSWSISQWCGERDQLSRQLRQNTPAREKCGATRTWCGIFVFSRFWCGLEVGGCQGHRMHHGNTFASAIRRSGAY